MSQREQVARWLYKELMEWVSEMYEAQGLGITPWEDCPPSIQHAWYEKADELLIIVQGTS